MAKMDSGKPRSIYIKIFLILLSMVTFIISVVSLLLYINFEDVALNLVQSYAREDLSKASYSELRIEKAMELLANTNESINEISLKVGFVNSSYFFTVFKKIRGITPTEYRINKSKSS